mgnify:CR=1 FL=1
MSEEEKTSGLHIPVLGSEMLEIIPESGRIRVIDATVGYGGHSSLILQKNRRVKQGA